MLKIDYSMVAVLFPFFQQRPWFIYNMKNVSPTSFNVDALLTEPLFSSNVLSERRTRMGNEYRLNGTGWMLHHGVHCSKKKCCFESTHTYVPINCCAINLLSIIQSGRVHVIRRGLTWSFSCISISWIRLRNTSQLVSSTFLHNTHTYEASRAPWLDHHDMKIRSGVIIELPTNA